MKGMGFCLAALLFLAATPATAQPKLTWVYLSSGLSFDHWRGSGEQGSGLLWEAKNNPLNTPHTFRSLNMGGAVRFSSDFGASVNARYFANSLKGFTTEFGELSDAGFIQGLGDFDVEAYGKFRGMGPIKSVENTLRLGLRIPGPYEPTISIWSGFGVYRLLLGYTLSQGRNQAYLRSGIVLPLGLDEERVLVRGGNFDLTGGYRYTHRLSRGLHIKPGIDWGSARYLWNGIGVQSEFSVDPALSLSWFFLPARELSFSSSLTAYSREDGFGSIYGSRRISLGMYLGWYL